jgi:hypothetical protein
MSTKNPMTPLGNGSVTFWLSTFRQPAVPLPAPKNSHCGRCFQTIILSTQSKRVKFIFCDTLAMVRVVKVMMMMMMMMMMVQEGQANRRIVSCDLNRR